MTGNDDMTGGAGGRAARLRGVRPTSGVGAVLLVTTLTLLAAAASKAHCLSDWVPGRQPKSCYNDIQYLWHARSMVEHLFPYTGDYRTVHQNGHLVAVWLGAGQIEYPVLSGVFAWLTALPVTTHTGYLVVNMLVLAPFALLTSALLWDLVGRRAYLFAAAPSLVAYAYLNWDLLPVAATVAGIWTWRHGRVGRTGVLLALGACFKIWPGFLLVPLLVVLVLGRRGADAARLVGAAVATAVAVNLPFVLADATGWWAPYLMQSVRANDRTTNSIWYWLFRGLPLETVGLLSAGAVVLTWAAVVAAGLIRARREGAARDGVPRDGARWGPELARDYPWLQVGAAMVTTYVVVGRVDSPQYGLWLLPFVALIGIPTPWVVAFFVTDLFLWFQWSWLWGAPNWLMGVAVAARVVVLAGLAVVFLISPTPRRDDAPAAEPGATPAAPVPEPTPGGRR